VAKCTALLKTTVHKGEKLEKNQKIVSSKADIDREATSSCVDN